MAELAAQLYFETPILATFAERPNLRLVTPDFNTETTSPNLDPKYSSWINADMVEELADARTSARSSANLLLEDRMQLLREGEYDQVPYLVDPLTTAGRANKAREEYGPNSREYLDAHQSLVIDCKRLFAEAWRKGSWEYFTPLRQDFDSKTGGYRFKNRQLLEMVADGVTPAAEPEEIDYRIGEYAEEVTYSAARKLGRLAVGNVIFLNPAAPSEKHDASIQLTVNTISECADWAIEAYERGSQESLGGYAPEKRKLMLRSVRYDQATDSRYQEQLGVSGINFTHEVVNEAMRRMKVIESDVSLSKPQVRATQMINTRGAGAIEVLQILDEVASEFSELSIFMGEVVDPTDPKDYASIPRIAEERQRQQEGDSFELADMLMDLEASATDHWAATGLVAHRVKQMLYAKAKLNPEDAAIAFDEATARGIEEVAKMYANGQEDAARQREREVFEKAPPPSYCGAGSCGLVGVEENSPEASKARALGLDGEMVRDNERPCPKCNKKTAHYDYKGNKACVNSTCEYRQINGKIMNGKSTSEKAE